MDKQLFHYYREMQRIRTFENKASELFEKGVLPGFLHSCIGQEAVAVGVCSGLTREDYIFTTHRGHGHVLAKGMKMRDMFAELFAKKTGSNRGKGGSMHIMDVSVGVLGANGVVGAGIPMAVGTALSSQMQNNGRVTVAFFGDGASNTGAFHEGINLAAVWKLPVIFLCENNKYSESTPTRRHLPINNIADRAVSYGIPGIQVDGMDVEAVAKVTQEAINRARHGEGPTLIEADTYRFMGHYIGDQIEYRPDGEFNSWNERDPIKLIEKKLENEGVLTDEIKTTQLTDIELEVHEAIEFARNSPDPSPEEAFHHLFV